MAGVSWSHRLALQPERHGAGRRRSSLLAIGERGADTAASAGLPGGSPPSRLRPHAPGSVCVCRVVLAFHPSPSHTHGLAKETVPPPRGCPGLCSRGSLRQRVKPGGCPARPGAAAGLHSPASSSCLRWVPIAVARCTDPCFPLPSEELPLDLTGKVCQLEAMLKQLHSDLQKVRGSHQGCPPPLLTASQGAPFSLPLGSLSESSFGWACLCPGAGVPSGFEAGGLGVGTPGFTPCS